MNVVWTDPAIQDLKSIREFIAKDSEYYASEFIERVITAVDKLQNFPQLGRIVPELQTDNIRELIYQAYRVIYRTANNHIEVLAAIHGGRDLAGLKAPSWEII